MKINSIRGQLGLLFLAFALLVTISVALTFWGIEAQKQDAVVINLAGRQRMLAQQMARLSLQMEIAGPNAHFTGLAEAASTFDLTLHALRIGGPAPYLPGQTVEIPGTDSREVAAELEAVQTTWNAFLANLDRIATLPAGSGEYHLALQEVQRLSDVLVESSDTVVRGLEDVSAAKNARLRLTQSIFFASTLLLLYLGAWTTRKNILEPLNGLKSAASRIGSGDLHEPVQASGPAEVRQLAGAFDTMRLQLGESQGEAQAWAETLEKRVARRTHELDALYQVSQEISSRLDVQHVLRSVTEKARELLGGDVATLCLLDGDQTIRLATYRGPEGAVTGKQSAGLGGLTGDILNSSQALVCGGSQGCGIMARPYLTSHIAAPLRVGHQITGALCVGGVQKDVFPPESVLLLTKLANSAAIALENARLYAQAERVAALEERQRIAAGMHDGLGQTLSSLGLAIDRAEEQLEAGKADQAVDGMRRARQTVGQAVQEARQAIASLLDEASPPKPLQASLQTLAQELSRPDGAAIQLVSGRAEPLLLSSQDAEQALMIAREAILNAQQHAGASRIRLELSGRPDEAVLLVADDGQGFDPERPVQDGRQHFGLRVVQARAAHLGGSLEVHSVCGQGTQVTLRWPLGRKDGGEIT